MRSLFDSLAYPASGRIVTIRTVADGQARLGSSYLFGEELRSTPLFTAVSADWGATVTYEAPGASERLTAGTVTPEYFEVLRVAPSLGLPLRPGERIEGVEGATASVNLPGTGMAPLMQIARPGKPDLDAPLAAFYSVGQGFFDVLGISLRAGRGIEAIDRAGSATAVVINERLARTVWPDRDPLGARLRLSVGQTRERDGIVVGVVADVRQNGLAEDVLPTVYLSIDQNPALGRTFSVRTAKPLAALAPDLRAAVHAADPLLAMPAPRTHADRLDNWASRHRRFIMSMLVLFGVFASLLCGLGLYAVVSLNAQSRRREFALRMALGARCQQVGWLVLRQALRLGVAGVAAGVSASFAVTGTLQALLHGVDRTDPVTLLIAAVTFLALAGAASLLPALRAARVDPVTMLKEG